MSLLMFDRCSAGDHITVKQVWNTASAVPPEAWSALFWGNILFFSPRRVNGCSFPTSHTEAQTGENWNGLTEHPYEDSRCMRSHLSGFHSLVFIQVMLWFCYWDLLIYAIVWHDERFICFLLISLYPLQNGATYGYFWAVHRPALLFR